MFLKNQYIHGLCLQYDILYVKKLKSQFPILFVVPVSQKNDIFGTKMWKKHLKYFGIFIMLNHMIVSILVMIAIT